MSIVQKLIDAWANCNVAQIVGLFSPAATWIVDGRAYEGHNAITTYIRQVLDDVVQTCIVLRRTFNDVDEPSWAAVEWAFRIQTASGCSEVEQAVLVYVRDEQITYMRTHNDTLRRCQTTLDAPLRPEHRRASYPVPARPMDKADILKLQHRHVMQGWRLGDADTICSCHAPASVILNAWEDVHGHAEIRTSAVKYGANFVDTHIEVHRVVYDGQNIALNQTWSCTNRLTGIRAGDQDLIMGVVQDNQIHYWREYFDPSQSAQTLEQTPFGNREN